MSDSEGNLIIVYNGELYNYKEIKKNLQKRHKFNSKTDTEVILYAYKEYGPNCVKKFNGMFAFCIYDKKNKSLFLSRDRLGIKPLYYYFDGKKFIFASEIKAILSHKIKRELNLSALNQFVTYAFTVNNETLFKNIYKLQPGHSLIFKNNKLNIIKYWDIQLNIQNNPESYYIDLLSKKLHEAVEKRLMSDVPIGAGLSGGIDSSTVVAIMSKLMDKPVKTFTLGFNDPSDENKYAKKVSEYCGTDHTDVYLEYQDITKELPKIIYHMEDPFGRPPVLPTYFLTREISKKLTVSLIGEGSDETFAGYGRYQRFCKIPKFSLKYLKWHQSMTFYLKSFYYNSLPLSKKSEYISSAYFNEDKQKFYSKELLYSSPETEISKTFLPLLKSTNQQLNTALLFDIKNVIPGVQLNRIDKLSMAHSHEMRVPFLDHEVTELSMTIPEHLKYNGMARKYIIQKIALNLLPKEIISREKTAFTVPLASYFEKEFLDLSKTILDIKNIKRRPYLNHNYINKFINNLSNKSTDQHLKKILFLTTLEIWHKMFLDSEKINLSINSYL